MQPISQKNRKGIDQDDFYLGCCYKGCGLPPQIHHVFGQKDELWNLVPACPKHHAQVKTNKEVKEYFEWIALQRATVLDVLKYSKLNDNSWFQRGFYLNLMAKKYGW